ncbi:MAG: oligosaccharide flippase family protein [Bacteroidales bacterium]|nr:oligosaccharide flippase family protein [Bacteroidales bacterium]
MRRFFVTNLFIVLLLNLLVKPFWIFGIDRSVQNAVGSEEYGFYFALFNFTLILNILLDLGITNYNNRNIAQHNQLLNKHLSNVLSLKLLLFVFYTVVVFSLAHIVRYNQRQLYLIVFLVINQFFLSLILYLRSNISALQLFKTDSIISVLDRLIMIILCSLMLWSSLFSKPFTIEKFVYAQTVSYVIAATIALWIVLKKAGKIYLHVDWQFFIVFLKQSYPYALLILLMAFYNRIDGVMLERMLENGKEQAGIYAQSFRILDAASMIAFLFSGLLLPMFSKMLKEKQDVYPLVQLSYKLIILPVIIFLIVAITYAPQIMNLLYHHNDDYSVAVFRVLIIGLFATSTTYIYGTLLTSNGNLKELNIMAFITMLINITLNLILIPRFQALGSAFSSITAQLFAAIFQIYLSLKIFHFKINKKFLLQLMFILVFTIVTACIVSLYISNWLIGSTIIITIGGLVIIFTKAIDIKMFISVLKSSKTE